MCAGLYLYKSRILNRGLSLKQGTGNRGTGNGEWGTGNGERGMGNGEWGTGNGERGMGNGEWGTGNGERGMHCKFQGVKITPKSEVKFCPKNAPFFGGNFQ